MPGRVALTTPPARLARAFDARLEVPDPGPREDAAPGEQVAALILHDETGVLVQARWGMVMSGRVNARGRPVMETIVNARAETVFGKSAFAGVGRAVLPVDAWYEWTGTAGRKTRWRIGAADGGLLAFAAIADVWTAPGGTRVRQLATLTCAPNADVADYHHRMPVILPDAAAVGVWLTAPADRAAALLAPLPGGRLSVRRSELK
ncbi:SOS response-associated peptidase [Rhodobacteraceae bacterium 2CG4]|uniref:Abasic site processing protein n=1 Tax=Halovulum marinum TaxID=2662447 RepID=A0A6L5Z6M3_9RHOB|nr:SOS response-associated peptidase [Halovulum marinum]MSU92218.1 SOS response-associated peptidase [Halovulum marinum]